MALTNPPDVTTLAQFAYEQQHPATAGWTSRDQRLLLLAEEAAELMVLAEDHDLAVRRRDRFAPSAPPETFLDRWVDVSPGFGAFLSMRYEGGEPTRPFVYAWAMNRAVESVADLTALAAAAEDSFGQFAPLYVRAWSADPANRWPGTVPDKRFLAAPVEALRARTMPLGLEVLPARDLTHYREAVAAYDDVDREHPDHPYQARIQPREDLTHALAAGLLFDVVLDGSWSGYVAADARSQLGLPGHTVLELIMTSSARGRGIGAGLTTGLARGVPGGGVLLGTIHHDNRGAYRAALAAGRIDVGGWFQVPLRAPGSVAPFRSRQSDTRSD